ncbi:hypothetical protein [Rhodococcus aetherivorans]|uniref:hypothetical protein n=1 Tax=Rhodococcus aetherivorans TaxID=191292 RepID=UPI00388F95C0
MKAYKLEIANDDEGICEIVFAKTARLARKLVDGTDLYYERWIDVRATRYPAFDGMEGLSKREFAKETWRHGWQWYDLLAPDPDEAADEEFYEWYDSEFGVKS